jgi:hypothetical protein
LSASSRVDRRVEEFRARVLEAAMELFEARGIDGTKIDDICEAADVAKRTLCNHFPTTPNGRSATTFRPRPTSSGRCRTTPWPAPPP